MTRDEIYNGLQEISGEAYSRWVNHQYTRDKLIIGIGTYVEEAIKLLKEQEPVGGWISVKDILPKENEAVNIVWMNTEPESYYEDIKGKPFVATGVYFRGKWYWWSSVVQDYLAEYGSFDPDAMDKAIAVTHWMPLPELPKEVNGDD